MAMLYNVMYYSGNTRQQGGDVEVGPTYLSNITLRANETAEALNINWDGHIIMLVPDLSRSVGHGLFYAKQIRPV